MMPLKATLRVGPPLLAAPSREVRRLFDFKLFTFDIGAADANFTSGDYKGQLCPNESGWWQGQFDFGWRTYHLFIEPQSLATEIRHGPSRDGWALEAAFTPTAEQLRTT